MLRLTPFLLFQGNCAEAMTFYHSCFGGELTITRLGETPMRDSFLPEHHSKVTYALLRSSLLEFSATDWLHPTREPVQGNTVGMFLAGDDHELQTAFDTLSQGAASNDLVTLKRMPFGLYGSLVDRFGVNWFFRGISSA
jgi:PhnB protein